MRSVLIRRDVVSWCLYDWANSAFITSVAVVLLPLYYPRLFDDPDHVTIGLFGRELSTSSEALWGYTNSTYMILLAIAAPVLGAMADSARGKKRFLAVAVGLGGIATAALALTGPGDYLLVSGLYVIAAFLWGAGNIFYDGFLPELTDDPKEMDSISAAGYGVGYLGGGLMLLVNLILLKGAGPGEGEQAGAVRLGFALVGAWWMLFSIPLFVAVRERPGVGEPTPGGGFFRSGLSRLKKTMKKVRRLPELGKFLFAFFLYNSGVGTIMLVAALYAKRQLGFTDETIVMVLLAVQFLGLPAAFAYIWLSRRIGTKRSIYVGIGTYVVVVLYALRLETVTDLWILGGMVALVQGGVQAMSRSLFGSMIPAGMSAEFFGFFSIFSKVGPFLGPLAFGVVRDITGSSRQAMLFLVVFFLAGAAVLAWVRVAKGREEATSFLSGGENSR